MHASSAGPGCSSVIASMQGAAGPAWATQAPREWILHWSAGPCCRSKAGMAGVHVGRSALLLLCGRALDRATTPPPHAHSPTRRLAPPPFRTPRPSFSPRCTRDEEDEGFPTPAGATPAAPSPSSASPSGSPQQEEEQQQQQRLELLHRGQQREGQLERGQHQLQRQEEEGTEQARDGAAALGQLVMLEVCSPGAGGGGGGRASGGGGLVYVAGWRATGRAGCTMCVPWRGRAQCRLVCGRLQPFFYMQRQGAGGAPTSAWPSPITAITAVDRCALDGRAVGRSGAGRGHWC